MTDTNSSQSTITCTRCKRPQPNLDELTRCNECGTPYCSSDCLRYDKTKHNKRCGRRTAPHAIMVLDGTVDEPFTRLDYGTYLYDRSRKDVFRLLIDCYRLRVDDDHNFDSGVVPDDDGFRTGFRRFLDAAAQRENILPEWWDEVATMECLAFYTGEGEGWYHVTKRVSKRALSDHYGSPLMAMAASFAWPGHLSAGPGWAGYEFYL